MLDMEEVGKEQREWGQTENMETDHSLIEVNIAVFREVTTWESVSQSDRSSE